MQSNSTKKSPMKNKRKNYQHYTPLPNSKQLTGKQKRELLDSIIEESNNEESNK